MDKKKTSILWTLISPTYESESHAVIGNSDPGSLQKDECQPKGELDGGVEDSSMA